MGEFDAVGEVMTGGLAARALEPAHGGAGGAHGACLNCGTGLIGPHCHRCGQSGHVHRTIGAIGHEIVHGVVHFEGKLWSTLPLLAWRPGELTRRYVAGERARFVSPMALFLFSIFTMFAAFSMAGLAPPADLSPASESVASSITVAQKTLAADRKEAIDDRAKAAPGSGEAARLTREIAELDRQLAALKTAQTPGARSTYTSFKQGKTGWLRLDKGVEKARKNPPLMLYKLQANSYKFSWALIPLSVPFVWLMFCWKRRYKLYDHAVFVIYSIAFMSLLFIAITAAAAIGVSPGWLVAAGLLIPPLHLYRQLRGAYELRRWSALLRTIVLLACIYVVVILFLVLLIVLGLMG